MYFWKKKKYKSLFVIVSIRTKSSSICQIPATIVPQKFDVIKFM
jgi:hypothetical protein